MVRVPGIAEVATELDELMRDVHPGLLGQEFHEISLDLHGVFLHGEPQTL